MVKFLKKRLKKVGLPAGTLIYTGEKKEGKPKITVIDYDEENLVEREVTNVEECFPFKDKPTVTWINVDGLNDIKLLEDLGKYFGCHQLVLDDILNTDQRPKMEYFDSYIYIVFKMISFDDNKNEINSEQVSMILGSNFLLTFQEEQSSDVFNTIRERLRTGKGRIRKLKADYLAYSLLDVVIDNYFVVLEKIGEKIQFLEEELVSNPKPKTLREIHSLKKELLFLRKAIWPLRDVVNTLAHIESPLINYSLLSIYFRDIYDHLVQAIDTIETFREMLSAMLDIYLSSISNRLNEIMKVLTIISTIFIPLTFIAGVYGMNFRFMPELESPFGYPAVLSLMFFIAILMLFYFKKKKWL